MLQHVPGPGRATFGLAVVLTLIAAASPHTSEVPKVADDSADRMIFWLGCHRVAALTDAELDKWSSRGVDGFACMVGHLRGMGGTQDFTGNPATPLRHSRYALQRRLRNSEIVERARARGMRMYLGADLVNYNNRSTPLRDWFDHAGWSRTVLPRMSDLAGAAKLLGFTGLAFDQELYPQRGDVESASWDWDYPANTHTEGEVRAKATQRGRQLMHAILHTFPGVELVAYDVKFPGTWEAAVDRVVNGESHAFASRLDINFWDGLTSVDGYRAIRFFDAIFYKSPHVGTWDAALQYNANRLAGLLSRHFSNWSYASSRVYVSPFSWIDPGPNASAFDDAHSPTYVRDQLLAFRKWGMGGEFANYVYSKNLTSFDYAPYVPAMREASSPADVDGVRPTLKISPGRASGKTDRIDGTASDNLAIWAVRWRDNRGGKGAARCWSRRVSDPVAGPRWETRWSFSVRAMAPGATRVRITASDIKGHSASLRIRHLGTS